MKKRESGFVLIFVLMIMLITLILMPALVTWIQNESRWTVKQQKTTVAFHLAEAGVDRGVWKLKSSTTTFAQAAGGITISSYTFSTTYSDIEGGEYRISFSSGPLTRQVTITSEGRDRNRRQVRAIRAIYENETIPGAVISQGNISAADYLSVQWGPIMAQGNITISDAEAAKEYFPRKFAKQTVSCSVSGYSRDTNGLTPPNTDNVEWWSDYDVAELPILDFTTLKSSAQATGTLNVYGCNLSTPTAASWAHQSTNNKLATYDATGHAGACNGSGTHATATTSHFQDSADHTNAGKNYVWFWDNDVEFTSTSGTNGMLYHGTGIYGTVIVLGNMTIGTDCGDNLGTNPTSGAAKAFSGNVPTEAWREHTKLTKTTYDSSTKNEYAADDGTHKTRSTFSFGGETWTGGPASTLYSDVGFRGLVYVGKNLTIKGPTDFYGALWVKGGVSSTNTGTERTVIFYDSSLVLPSLNVVLIKKSWEELPPTTTPWP